VTGPVSIRDVPREVDLDEPPGYRAPWARLGPLIGAERLGATIYELGTDQSVCPYHYEYGNEEWVLVLDGHPTLRAPDGEHVLEPGDVVCFPEGPEGAHKGTNREPTAAFIVMLSTKAELDVTVYPDSGKIGVYPLGKLFRETDAVDYWDGETGRQRPAGLDP
jgi:uncharacterized cupin superfamily protein